MSPLTDITILIAEDERPVRMLLRVVLEAAGARVLEAEHGAAALRMLDLHPEIDLLCTDVNMPIMDGAALVDAVRTRRDQIPIVACTALHLEASHPGLHEQVDALIQKPFIPGELIRSIDRTLRAARSRNDRTRAAS